jgi:hypothetical protein
MAKETCYLKFLKMWNRKDWTRIFSFFSGRDFKSKYENSLKEVTEKNTAITKLEEQLKKLQEDLNKPESEKSATRSDVVSSPDDRLAEAETLVEQVCPARQCFFHLAIPKGAFILCATLSS